MSRGLAWSSTASQAAIGGVFQQVARLSAETLPSPSHRRKLATTRTSAEAELERAWPREVFARYGSLRVPTHHPDNYDPLPQQDHKYSRHKRKSGPRPAVQELALPT